MIDINHSIAHFMKSCLAEHGWTTKIFMQIVAMIAQDRPTLIKTILLFIS
jgi:hypothetical protein